MAKQTTNYQEAFDEIQEILEEIEGGNISIDELSEKVKRASTLMDICRRKLKSTEDDVQQILEKMNQQEDTPTKRSP